MTSNAELIEQSLLHIAESGTELRHGLYQRFFAAFPDRRNAFLCPEATSIRMTDETLQMLYGIAAGEDWVWLLISELVATHRSYGQLPLEEYHAWVDMLPAEVAQILAERWSAPMARAWHSSAEELKAMITRAISDWDRILPSGQARVSA
jgi:hemoglobin-like flavoprotein